MLVALGESYEKLEKTQEAKKCYWRAYSVGDIEGTALIKLAKLHEAEGEEEKAANFYTKYVEQSEAMGVSMNPGLGHRSQVIVHSSQSCSEL